MCCSRVWEEGGGDKVPVDYFTLNYLDSPENPTKSPNSI